jgi:hypothetical protein
MHHSPLKVNRRFGGTYISISGIEYYEQVASTYQAGILLGLFDPEDGSDTFFRNVDRLSALFQLEKFRDIETTSNCISPIV